MDQTLLNESAGTGPMDEESLFSAALDRPPGADRRAFLDGACAGDPALRGRIERLLAAAERTAGLLDASRPSPNHGLGLGPPAKIAGRYELIKPIGEGGMGSVWLAEQFEPVRRRVALKLIRRGMDSRVVLARFEAERQALALMDHPNIARVFDGGTAEDGRPFFAMEYVEGVPITEYCDGARLDVAERLALFVDVCRAVQHAHTKGVIHRDLKPGNILVGLCDGKPVPKVIDFGLAKATGPALAESAAVTAVGTALGTPLYMSPEQADPGNIDIDARADIYALGVILYELLTGTTPLERRRFREAGWSEILRLIREEDPPRPSARLSGSDSLPSLAALRQSEPGRLTRLVRGDLDWIVMKCLEKDRSRRYETPSGLARDLLRYLEDESVEARPPSTGYRLGKFLRRNRGAAIAAVTILLLLVGGIVGTSWGLYRADRARKAEAKRAEGERLASARALRRLQQVEEGVETLASVFDDLDPIEEEKEDKPLRAILGDRLVGAAERLEGEGVGDPLVVARLQDRLGQSLVHLGLASKAIPLFEKARAMRTADLGADDPATLESMNNLAEALGRSGMNDKALPLLEKTLALRKARLGVDHTNTLESMLNLAEGYRSARKMDLAMPLYEETLRLTRAKLGPTHANVLVCLNNLAVGYQYAGKPEKAVPLLEEALTRMKADLPEGHLDTLAGMNNLAAAYRATGKTERAVPLYEEALKLTRAKQGAANPATLFCMNNLAAAYRATGKPQRSLSLLQEAGAAIEEHRFEVQHADRIIPNLLGMLELQRQFDEAESWRRKWLAAVKEKAGADSIPYADELQGLGDYLLRRHRWAEAESPLRDSLAIREKKEPDAWAAHRNRSLLGYSLTGQGKHAEAEPWLIRGYEGMRLRSDQTPPSERYLVTVAGQWIVRLYESWDRPEKVSEWKAKLADALGSRPEP